MAKGCFSMRSHTLPSALVRRYMRYGSSISSFGRAACGTSGEKSKVALQCALWTSCCSQLPTGLCRDFFHAVILCSSCAALWGCAESQGKADKLNALTGTMLFIWSLELPESAVSWTLLPKMLLPCTAASVQLASNGPSSSSSALPPTAACPLSWVQQAPPLMQ